MTRDIVIEETRAWIDKVVVGLGLCPFAEVSIANGGLEIHHCPATDPDELEVALDSALRELQSDPGQVFDGCLLIHPNVLTDFEAFNEFLDRADAVADRCAPAGEFQIASFHPDYRFAGTRPDDVGNYTNRSPYPMLHVLREASVERALANFPDPEGIPQRNIERLEALGLESVLRLVASCRSNERS